MSQKPSIPKGTRDFNPLEATRRNYIFDTVRRIFTLYGYAPIETPAMENLSTLLGKYGEEGDKLLFKIINSGDFLSDVNVADLPELGPNAAALKICEKGLRYDLTVPFARFVVQHRNDLVFPFKRYQLQPVWRADRPQKGRYREFYQCDVDVIGSDSLLNELELLQIVDDVFKSFGIRVGIKINNRKVLSGIAEMMGRPDMLIEITVAMDKMDKIGFEAIEAELLERGLDPEAITKLKPILLFQGTTEEKIILLEQCFTQSGTTEQQVNTLAAHTTEQQTNTFATHTTEQQVSAGMVGVTELKTLFRLITESGISQSVELDLSLARGLSYYTGAIFEVKALDFEMGSICGGGRYDNLTGVFGLPGVSGVGISFGADRIFDVLLGLNKFPTSANEAPKVLFMNLGETESLFALSCLTLLRSAGIISELYPDQVKMKKQFEYADKRGIPFAAIIGEEELKHQFISLKNLKTGDQHQLSPNELKKYLEQR